MKKYYLLGLISFLLFSLIIELSTGHAQSSDQFKYQAVLRDTNGNILANQQKDVKIDILQGNETGLIVFTETHNVITSAQGVINLNIGSINSTGIAAINWSNNTYYIRITVDGVLMGTSQLVSVPYALNAKTASTFDYFNLTNKPFLFSGDYNDLTNKPILFSGTWSSLTGRPTTISGYGITDSFDGKWTSLSGKPTFAIVAITGSYQDLIDKPLGNNVGDMQYWNGSTWINVAVGLPGQYLQLNTSNIPTWSGPSYPIISSTAISSVTTNTAIGGGNVINDGGAYISSRGICWGTSPNPTIANNKTSDGQGVGSFSSNLSGLTAGTTYYIRSYATNSVGLAYGNEVSFNTLDVQNIPTYVPKNGLAGWWPFNGNANDESGNGNNGTVNGPTIISDRFGKPNSAYSFDGINDWINMPSGSNTSINITSNFSLSFWFKTTQGTNAGIIGFGDNINGTKGGYLAAIGNGQNPVNSALGKMTVYSKDTWYTGTSILTDNAWHFACITLNGNILTIFIDNKLDATFSNANAPLSFNGLRSIGAQNTGLTGYFKGLIDDIGIWNRALSQQEINDLYNSSTSPYISTTVITNLTSSTATCGGNIVSDSVDPITDRGVCWSTTSNPIILNSKTSDGTGLGSFTSNLNGLSANTTYYVRAFATNSQGTTYGNEVSFTTSISLSLASLTINEASGITSTNAFLSVNITSDGNMPITERGICYNTSTNPTTSNNKVVQGSGSGYFGNTITGFLANTEYYVRAYAINSQGTAYSNEINFRTSELNTITDIDGNIYHTVTIGTQVWMLENLKVTKYNDGTAISTETDNYLWGHLTSGAYCWYNNSIANGNVYGALYNWYAVNTGKLAPIGWHVPSDTEWTTLTDYLGGESISGGKLKEVGTTHWTSPNTGASNSSGFTGLPGGYRGAFDNINNTAVWWTSTASDATNAWNRDIFYNSNAINRNSQRGMVDGYSIRCIKD